MFNFRHYVPIMKNKQAECGALSELPHNVKSHMTPLLEIVPIPCDPNTGEKKKTIEAHLTKLPKALETSWGSIFPIFLDFRYLDTDPISGDHPMVHLCGQLRLREIKFIPTPAFDCPESYQRAIAKIIKSDQRGLCIRIQKRDLEDINEMNRNIHDILELCGISLAECDLIIDLESIHNIELKGLFDDIREAIRGFPNLKEWRTFTLCGSSVPAKLTHFVGKNTVQELNRTEFLLWNMLIFDQNLPRVPAFGDYGTRHPEMPEFGRRIFHMYAKLVYTLPEAYLVIMKDDVKEFGWDQFNRVCEELVGRPESRDEDYSWGDGYLKILAARGNGTGSPMTWIKASFSHHIAQTLEQIEAI